MTDEPIRTPTLPGYDRWAPVYDDYDNPLIALEEPVVRALIGPVGERCVADVGCGTGRHALPLCAAGANVTGVDFSSGMLDVLRRKATHQGAIEIVAHDLNDGIPLASDGFDLVLCCLVIEHLTDLARTHRELARICRPGGRVVISDFHPELVRRGYHARFHDPDGGAKFQIDGAHHTISDYVMAAIRAGLTIDHISEHTMTEEVAQRSNSARKWLGLPMLLTLRLIKPPAR